MSPPSVASSESPSLSPLERLARTEPLSGHLATLFRWDITTLRWISTRVRLMSLSPTAIKRGGLRRVFSGLARHFEEDGGLTRVLLKEFISEGDDDDRRYWDVAKMQAEGARMAEEFNKGVNVAVGKVGVLCCWVVDVDGFGVVGNMEDVLKGDWDKWNDNCGGVMVDSSEGEVGNCFSHWSWVVSAGEVVVVDCQGVGGMMTDVVVHKTGDGAQRRAVGSWGRKGIERFLKSHTCGVLCASAGLPLMNNGCEAAPGVGLWTMIDTAVLSESLPERNIEEVKGDSNGTNASVIEKWTPTVLGVEQKDSSKAHPDFSNYPRWTM